MGNVHLEPLNNGDQLGQAEYVFDKVKGAKLRMQSSDGNLLLYGGPDRASISNPLWAASDEECPEFCEHYARVAYNGYFNLISAWIY